MRTFHENTVYMDDREPPKVLSKIKDYFETQQVPTKKTRLDVGDFVYNGIIVERKDCVDFIASWKDARIINQRNNMIRLSQKMNYHPYVVIQGTFTDATRQLDKIPNLERYKYKAWLNGILSLQEKGIGVIQLERRANHNHLAMVLEGLAKYKNEDRILHDIFIEPEGQSWDVKAYQCFKGVGYSTAKKLADAVSIQDLLRRPRENAIKTLCAVPNVGKKRATYIYETIHKKEKLVPYKELK